jgi:hypothetical protein
VPTFSVTHIYERTEEDIRRIAVDSEHPLESPYRQACIKWVEENPIPLPPNPNDLPVGTVFTHAPGKHDPVEYVALDFSQTTGEREFLRTDSSGYRGVRTRSRSFWKVASVEIVFQP